MANVATLAFKSLRRELASARWWVWASRWENVSLVVLNHCTGVVVSMHHNATRFRGKLDVRFASRQTGIGVLYGVYWPLYPLHGWASQGNRRPRRSPPETWTRQTRAGCEKSVRRCHAREWLTSSPDELTLDEERQQPDWLPHVRLEMGGIGSNTIDK